MEIKFLEITEIGIQKLKKILVPKLKKFLN